MFPIFLGFSFITNYQTFLIGLTLAILRVLPVATFNKKAKTDSSVCLCVYVMSDECSTIEFDGGGGEGGVRMKEKGRNIQRWRAFLWRGSNVHPLVG